MHIIGSENNQIKIAFDKSVKGWTWDKSDIKYVVDSYMDRSSILIAPCTAFNYKELLKKYAENDNFYFEDSFIEAYQKEIKQYSSLASKKKLLDEKLSLETIDKRANLLDYSHLPEEYRKPFKHQKLELEYAVRFPAFYSLDEMGLGKTRVAIERHLFLKNKLKKITKSFIICPISLMYNWANEIKKWCPEGTSYMLVTGTKKDKIEEIGLLKDKVDFFIVNFEGIASIKNELLNLIDSKTNIIIDEFIKIKNPHAVRSQNLVALCNRTEYVHGLCGTPVAQGSVDLFSPNLCIDKGKKFGFSYDRFIQKYYWKQGWNLAPKRGTYDTISKELYKNAIRFTKKECLDIPDKLYNQILIDLPPVNQKVYDQMVTFCLSELEGKEVTAPIILVQLLRLSQITSGFIKTPSNEIKEFKDQPKLNALKDIIDSNNGTSIIIWSRFVRDIRAIANLCKEQNLSFGCLVGSTGDFNIEPGKTDKTSPIYQLYDLIKPASNSPIDVKSAYKSAVKKYHPDFNHAASQEDIDTLKKINALYTSVNRFENMILPSIPESMIANFYDIPSNLIGTDSFTRQSIVDKFQAGNIQVIIGTAATGGLGINLTKAERVIYYANDYSLINRLQSEDRAHRAGQTNKVTYYDILANNTIDVSILNILSGKKKVSDVITRDNLRDSVKGKI